MSVLLLINSKYFCWNKCHAAPSTSDFSESNTGSYRLYTCLGIRYPACSGRSSSPDAPGGPELVSQSIRARAALSKSSSVFFARTHEVLQYHFRTVALAFEYDKDGRSRNAERLRFAHSRDGKGFERSRNVRGIFRPKSRRFSEPRPHRRGENVPTKLLGSLATEEFLF